MQSKIEYEQKKILDYGEIQLIDVMGDDLRIVQTARVSYGKDVVGQAELTSRDVKLIKYLLDHDHGTPFESVVFQFRVKCPIFVMRQWIRHRMASYNEISGRYTELTDEFYHPSMLRTPSQSNKQGSGEDFFDERLLGIIEASYEASYKAYQDLLAGGVSREMARMVLPLSIYTEFYWTVNTRSLMNFLRLRMDEHAQWEIQEYARGIYGIFCERLPVTAGYFKEWVEMRYGEVSW
jgi:thymidylate synthase (FAD)